MKNLILTLFAISTIFYLVEYKAYTWDPCVYDGNGIASCVLINCGIGGCEVGARSFFVKSLDDVKNLVDRNGTEHLDGVYRIEYGSGGVAMHRLKLVPAFEIVDEK